jgi:hypothetical protein
MKELLLKLLLPVTLPAVWVMERFDKPYESPFEEL